MPLTSNLRPEKALIFRITHRRNVRWILDQGLWCPRQTPHAPEFVAIGNAELIERRSTRSVPVEPGGTLDDYVPFYFTPYSPMLYNIKTGRGGVQRRTNAEIVILVSSLPRLAELGVQFVFSDRHAYLQAAEFSSDMSDLDRIDFTLLREKNFKRDPEDPERFERYQAEALLYRHAPADALLGIVGYNDEVRDDLAAAVSERGLSLKVLARPSWYF